MEQLVQKLTEKMTASLQVDDEKRAVIQYGLFALVQMVSIGLVITLFGLLTRCLWECWIVYMAVGLLRKSTGGAHASTSNGCFVVSVVAVSVIGWLSHLIPTLSFGDVIAAGITAVVFLAGCLLVYWFSPVEAPNKPLKPEKIKRLRKQSLMTLSVYLVFIAIFSAAFFVFERATLSLALSLSLATLWQSLTLVKAVLGKPSPSA